MKRFGWATILKIGMLAGTPTTVIAGREQAANHPITGTIRGSAQANRLGQRGTLVRPSTTAPIMVGAAGELR